MHTPAIRTRLPLTALLLLSLVAAHTYARQEPAPADAPPVPAAEELATTSVLEPGKIDEIVELLSTSFSAHLTLKTALRTAECTRSEPNCAPLYFAQDVVLGPWNTVRLLRMIQELPDKDVATIARPRDYDTPALPPGGVVSPEIVSLAEYTFEQQVALYEQLEAWQITLERYSAAVASNDEPAAVAQRRALEEYGASASTAASAVSAASLQFLESITPVLSPFGFVGIEDVEAAKENLRDRGIGPEVIERFSALGIRQEDSRRLVEEIAALNEDAPAGLLEGLTAVARGYDRLADVLTVPTDPAGNLRPVADAGPDQAVPTGDSGDASVALSGTRSTDPEAAPLAYLWTATSATATGAQPIFTLAPGTHHIALTVADGKGGADVDIVTVTVGDAAAPVISALTATPNVLWPPNRQLVLVTLDVKAVDNDDPTPLCQVISVGLNAPASTTGVAAAEPDVVLNGSLTVLLRADPSGAIPGRAYTITVQCTDKSNHSSTETVFVPVSH